MNFLIEIFRDENEEVIDRKIIGKSDSKARPRNKETILIEDVNNVKRELAKIHIDEFGVISVIEDTDVKDVNEAFIQMDKNIIEKASEEYGTKRENAQLANSIEYLFRVVAPDLFVSNGLKARKALGVFAVDDALDTEQKIIDYHRLALKEISDSRNTEIINYLTLKADRGL